MSFRNKRKCVRSRVPIIESPFSTPQRRAPAKRSRKATVAAAAALRTPEVINILEDSPVTSELATRVDEKVDTFFKSGHFTISSDEDDEIEPKKKQKPTSIVLLDDPDDDCKETTPNSEYDLAVPSTSGGSAKAPASTTNKTEPNISAIEDIMEFVDDILEKKDSCSSRDPPITDMKSLEDYRKETEEMLKNATTLLSRFKSPETPPPPVVNKEEVTSPQVVVGSCPICLESVATRPASVTVCGHIFCTNCIKATATTLKKCPVCRKSINLKKIHPVFF